MPNFTLPEAARLRTAIVGLAAFLTGVLAAAGTEALPLPLDAVITGIVTLACAGACTAWTLRQARAELAVTAYRRVDNARLMDIIRSSREAIITIDASQRIVLMNPMAQELFGCDDSMPLGAPLSRFVPERYRDAHAGHIEQFGATDAAGRFMGDHRVLYALRADGSEFPIEASISQIEHGDEKLYTVMLRDVTPRVRAEEALRQSREDLRQLSANLQRVSEEEKARIAHELHDDLGQSLTALKLDLSLIERTLAHEACDASETCETYASNGDVRERLRAMAHLIDSTVASVRRIAANQRPAMLDDLGLVAAIDWLCDEFSVRYGIRMDRHFDAARIEFSDHAATAIFRIVQEALTNVAKHAHATLVSLALHATDDDCTLQIADDGCGKPYVAHAPDPNVPHAAKHFGLLGMRERVHMLGGTISAGTPGKGFSITITFPIAALQSQETPT